MAEFDRAEAMGADPDGCSAARWMAAMLRGDFAAAWRESDLIRQRGGDDPHRFWMGEDPRGRRVMVRCLHGFGDAIQFLRYVPRLRAMAAHVIVEVAPRMVELAPMLDGVDEVVTWGSGAPASPPMWEVQVEVMELPYLFRTTSEELPVAVEYLRVPREDVEEAAKAMGETSLLRVGVVWSRPGRGIRSDRCRRLVWNRCCGVDARSSGVSKGRLSTIERERGWRLVCCATVRSWVTGCECWRR